MIGTHKDCLPLSLDSDELKHCLEPIEEKVLFFGSGNPIAFISCLSQTSEEKRVLQDIRTLIESTPGIEKKKDSTCLVWFGTSTQGSQPESKTQRCSQYTGLQRRGHEFCIIQKQK